MTTNECTLEEGIMFYEAAGFQVELDPNGKGFNLYEEQDKIAYYSSTNILYCPYRIMNDLRKRWRDRGIKVGQTDLRSQIKTIFGL